MLKQYRSTVVAFALAVCLSPLSSFAQATDGVVAQQLIEPRQVVEPAQQVTLPQTENFAVRFARDHQAIWSAPFKVKRGDVKWLLPLSAGAAALVGTGADWKVRENFADIEGVRPATEFISHLGGGGPMMAASGAVLAIGKLTKNERAADTGKIAFEAVLHTQLLVGGIKMLANRERPNKVDGEGGFFQGGQSFPSGHAATTFAFATVVAGRHNSKWVKIGAYGLAAAVSMARVGGLNHFPSDIVIGASIGHLIGKYILRRHDTREIQ